MDENQRRASFERIVLYTKPTRTRPIDDAQWTRILDSILPYACEPVQNLRSEVGIALAHYDALNAKFSGDEDPLALMKPSDAAASLSTFASKAREFSACIGQLQPEVRSRISDELGRSRNPDAEDEPLTLGLLCAAPEIQEAVVERFGAAEFDWSTIADAAELAAQYVGKRPRRPEDPNAYHLGVLIRAIWNRHCTIPARRGRDDKSPFEKFLGEVLQAAGVKIAPESLARKILD